MARPKKATTELASLDACNRALGELREAEIDLALLTADRDRAVAEAQARYEVGIDASRSAAAGLRASLEAYYYGHLAEIEKDGAKHVALANGRIGRRDNPPALKRLNAKWTWPAIENAVRVMFSGKFFRVKAELDRQALKDAQIAAETLRQLGLKVEADETFYAEPAKLAPVEQL